MANLLFETIQEDLRELEEELLQAVQAPLPAVTEMGTMLVQSGGKRLRPALFFLAAHCGPCYDKAKALPLAAAIEMIHMASLEHDDVIDEADSRRGKPTANAIWGNKLAILGGDYLLSQALCLTVGHGYDESVSVMMARLLQTLVRGEILQDEAAFRICSEEEYYKHIEEKTADFLALCCELGAKISGADAELQQGLRRYGHDIGMAFQITDDLLDVLGETNHIGKPAGNDIRQGVITLPVLRALEAGAAAPELRSIVTKQGMSEAELQRALELVRASDGVDYAKARAEAYLRAAEDSLPRELRAEVREAFRQAAAFIGKRSF